MSFFKKYDSRAVSGFLQQAHHLSLTRYSSCVSKYDGSSDSSTKDLKGLECILS